MDIAILCCYIISAALSNKRSLLWLCAIPSLFAIIIPASYYSMQSISVTFSFFSIVTASLAVIIFAGGRKITSICMIALSIYDVVFAVDSIVNKDYATWIYNHHESIVIGLHALIMLSFNEFICLKLAGAFCDIRSFIDNKRSSKKDEAYQRS